MLQPPFRWYPRLGWEDEGSIRSLTVAVLLDADPDDIRGCGAEVDVEFEVAHHRVLRRQAAIHLYRALHQSGRVTAVGGLEREAVERRGYGQDRLRFSLAETAVDRSWSHHARAGQEHGDDGSEPRRVRTAVDGAVLIADRGQPRSRAVEREDAGSRRGHRERDLREIRPAIYGVDGDRLLTRDAEGHDGVDLILRDIEQWRGNSAEADLHAGETRTDHAIHHLKRGGRAGADVRTEERDDFAGRNRSGGIAGGIGHAGDALGSGRGGGEDIEILCRAVQQDVPVRLREDERGAIRGRYGNDSAAQFPRAIGRKLQVRVIV